MALREVNPYVSEMIRDFTAFHNSLKQVAKQLKPQSIEKMWGIALKAALHAMVEGFSRVKKCTNESRAVMQVDMKAFVDGVTAMSPIVPIPGTAHVKNYIQGFYNPPEFLFQWIEEVASEYTSKQMISLVNLVCSNIPNATNAKKLQKDIATQVEELYKNLAKNHATAQVDEMEQNALTRSTSSSSISKSVSQEFAAQKPLIKPSTSNYNLKNAAQ